jgi:hypothetical protein
MPEPKKKDVVHLVADLPDGHKLMVRERDGQLRPGVACPHVDEGKPFLPGHEYVHLEKREDGAYDCETLYGGDGPVQVTTESYRSGWDEIWGKKTNQELN